jgi:hypothetical protein
MASLHLINANFLNNIQLYVVQLCLVIQIESYL